ncbi:MAG: hypothetical protein IJ723_03380 [Ruminococcus sp.]|nr:hypothetical protein [Ruminococcus sp.]
MAKMYTLDNKLLVDKPELRVGDKCYAVDDRAKTVKKAMKMFEKKDETDSVDMIDETLKLLLGTKAFKEIEALELSWAAYEELMELALAAATGEEPETVKKRFQRPEEE